RLLRKHPDTFTAAGFVPAAFVLGILAGPFLAPLSPLFGVTYAGSLGLYGLTVLLASLAIALQARQLCWVFWLPLVFAVIHGGAGAGILLEALAGLWQRPVGGAPMIPQVRTSRTFGSSSVLGRSLLARSVSE